MAHDADGLQGDEVHTEEGDERSQEERVAPGIGGRSEENCRTVDRECVVAHAFGRRALDQADRLHHISGEVVSPPMAIGQQQHGQSRRREDEQSESSHTGTRRERVVRISGRIAIAPHMSDPQSSPP
jgi:hypothetical protein